MNERRAAVLRAIADGPTPGPAVAAQLGVSRAAVWKHVESLREAGFRIESGDDGYRLAAVPEFGGQAVEFGLEAPFDVEYHETVGSTNDRARELAVEGAADVVVLADEQTGGRGRLRRTWTSPSGGVWLSAVLRPTVPPARAPLFTLAAAVATARAAREAGVDASIKWPNDVLVDGPGDDGSSAEAGDDQVRGKKFAGVLTEMEGEADRVSWLVAGVGVNANVDPAALEADSPATSLQAERGAPVDRRRFTQRLLEGLHDLRADPDAIVPAWRDLAATLGQQVRVETAADTVEGEAVDVTDAGALVVETAEERVVVTAGDCEHLRPAADDSPLSGGSG
jgi:BirA family biotin operon repressor/biotin-[acetyl-CoA-carboxylase] ligase